MKISLELADFLVKHPVIPPPSDRDLRRSVAAQVKRLSDFYTGKVPTSPWKGGSDKVATLRRAYTAHYLPLGLVRAGAVFEELFRLGYARGHLKTAALDAPWRALDLGAGPGSTALGWWAAQLQGGSKPSVHWTWLDRDLPLMAQGSDAYYSLTGHAPRLIKRDLERELKHPEPLRVSERYDLWTANFSLRELGWTPVATAQILREAWRAAVRPGGLAVVLEAGSRDASRWLLALRKELLALGLGRRGDPWRIVTPCLGEQACGALADADDWCHETVSWARPLYYRKLDELTGMDHRMLDFSYLVVQREPFDLERPLRPQRLVSPPHAQGSSREFWVCGSEGKRKARAGEDTPELERGTILIDPEDLRAGKSYVRFKINRVI